MSNEPATAGPIAVWHAEHVYFGQLLNLLERELDVFHRGERPSYELMLDVISYLRDYTDQFHHPREDRAFAHLARHCPEMDLALARLLQEHRVIAHAGEALRQVLTDILSGSVVTRAEVEAAVATYLTYYRAHLAREEGDVLKLAEKHLTAEDWRSVKDAVPAGRDPLFGPSPEERYKQLRRQIALQA